MLRVLDLFSGIGGISLGLERTGGFKTVAFCEIDPYCRAVLSERWEAVPVFDDVRRLDAGAVPGGVDLICGGFPCQPFSVAGKQKGQEDERHLWPEYARLIREIRPRWVLAENVPGLRVIAADEVLEDLEAAGYSAWPLVVGADDVGAPHRRKRVWIVAHTGCCAGGRREGEQGWGQEERTAPIGDGTRTAAELADPCSARPEGARDGACGAGEAHAELTGGSSHRWPARPGERQAEWEPPRVVGNAKSLQRSGGGHNGGRCSEGVRSVPESRNATGDPWRGDRRDAPQPGLGGDADGLPHRMESRVRRERLKALGNSVVPQVVEAIGRAILKLEKEMR